MKLGLRKTIKKPNPDIVSEIVEKVKSEGKLSEDQFDDNKDSIGNKAETNQIKAKKLMEYTNTFPQVHLFFIKFFLSIFTRCSRDMVGNSVLFVL